MILTCTHPVQFSADALEQVIGVPDGKAAIRHVCTSLYLSARLPPLIDWIALQYQATNSALKHIGKPEDIANLVSFLAGKESDFITGQTISIDGGSWMD
jgi:NAD(P)-dependent dehydrogenase (short-subunit alcohol dehydrogenase family)